MLCFYIGGDSRSYPDYLDRFTGRMLEAEPGFGVYDVDVAPGRNPGLPVPPGDGRWALAPDEDGTDSGNEAETLPEPPADVPLEPEPAAEPQPQDDPEDPAAPEGSETEPDHPADEATNPEGVE